jgi:hypothetical protein
LRYVSPMRGNHCLKVQLLLVKQITLKIEKRKKFVHYALGSSGSNSALPACAC